jgi:hypothetical protein
MDASTAAEVEQSLPPGVYRIELETTEEFDIGAARDRLYEAGIPLLNITERKNGDLWITTVDYVRPDAEVGITVLPLAIIPILVPLAITAVVAIGIFKIGDLTTNITKLLLVAGAVVVVSLAVFKKGSIRSGNFELKRD